MSGKYGNIWIWFILIIDVILIAMMIILFKTKVISMKWFFFILILLITLFLILLLVQIIKIFNYSEDSVVNSNKKSSSQMFLIRSRINKFLAERPNGDTINWDGGRFGREEIRAFTTPDGDIREFYGVAALLGHYKKWVVIIYSLDKQDIIKYVGDPSPAQLDDPFFNFKYFDSGRRDTFGFGRDDYYGSSGSQHFHIGGSQRDDRRTEGKNRATDGVEKAFETLKRSG